MDALALLCNLHADGPASLEKLRRGGRRTIEALCAAEVPEIAELLGVSLPAAKRLQREARHLAERLPEGLLEREAGVDRAPRATPVAEGGERAEPQAAGPDEHERELDRHEQASKPGVVEAVLEVWRSRDAADPPEPLPAEGLAELTLRPQPRPGGQCGTPLSVALVDGLTAERTAALARVGCTLLETLADADPLALSRPGAGGLPVTVALRLQYLARRLLAARAAPGQRPAAPRNPFQGPPRASEPSLEAGGPFA
jgi:hypothetical protein